MPDHFATLGFPCDSPEAYGALLESLSAEAEEHPCVAGSYQRWRDASGLEIWIQRDGDGNLVGATPYFAGPAVMEVVLTGAALRGGGAPHDVTIEAWPVFAEGEETHGSPGYYPFLYDSVNARVHSGMQLPRNAELCLAAFAHEASCFADEEAYDAAQSDREAQYAAESFVPVGMFRRAGEPRRPEALGLITGRVAEHRYITNPRTGRRFHAFRIRSYGGEFNVVAEEALFPEPPPPESILRALCWLAGRLVKIHPRPDDEKEWLS